MAKWRHKNTLPVFDAGDFYSYFTDLVDRSTGYSEIDRIRASIYRNAAYYYSTNIYDEISLEAQSAPETITSAIEFLNLAAENERRKEIALIEQYLKAIENKIPKNLRKNRTYEQIINKLKLISNQLTNSQLSTQNIDEFYIELTTYINMIRRNIDEYKHRLEQIIQKNITTWNQLADRSTLFRAEGDLHTLIKSIIGIQEQEKRNSFSSLARNAVFDFLDKNGLQNNINLQDNFLGIMGGLIIDLEHYIEQNNSLNVTNEKQKERVQQSIQNYFQQSDTYFLNEVKKIIKNNAPSKELIEVLSGMESALGINYSGLGNKGKKIEERQKKMEQSLYSPTARRAAKGERNYIGKKLHSLGLDNVINQYSHITWTVRGDKNSKKPLAGIIYEGIAGVLEGGGRRIGGTAAIDRIDCSLIGTLDNQDNNNYLSDKLTAIANHLKQDNIQEREERMEDNQQLIIDTNNELAQLIKELENDAKQLGVPENDLFIYHESLKLYGTMELANENGRKATKFHGRDMLALNMLDELYALSGLDETVQLLDKQALKGVLLNLSNLTVGNNMKTSVENYFSIFAGMLMFSDIRNMALELGKETEMKIQYASTKNIHLYLLNDTYYPASYILTNVYQALKSGVKTLSVKDGAKASINTNGATTSIKTYVSYLEKAQSQGQPSPYRPEDWDIMAEEIAAGTRIQLSFLSTFLNFSQKIFDQIQ